MSRVTSITAAALFALLVYGATPDTSAKEDGPVPPKGARLGLPCPTRDDPVRARSRQNNRHRIRGRNPSASMLADGVSRHW